MRRAAFVLLVVLALAVGSSSAAAPERTAMPAAKKPCKLVTKKVRGKKVKVRICAKAKTNCKFVTKRIKGKKKRVKVCPKKKPTPTRSQPQPPQPRTPAPESPQSPPPLPSADVLGRQLATQVSAASDTEAGYEALLSIARALHIGVYTGDGRQIVEGSERGPTDFWLYDFELDVVFASMRAGSRQSLDETASFLTASRSNPDGEPITPERLRSALIGSARDAAAQLTSPRARLPLLLRELGLRQQPAYDLLQDVPASSITLDPLQALLIIADLSARRQGSTPPAGGELSLAQAGCGGIGGRLSALDSFIANFLGMTPTADAHLAGTLHQMLSYSRTTAASQSTHYAPGPHHPEAARELRFGILVTMNDVPGNRFSPQQLTCGGLAGVTFPGPGPVPRANVEWQSFEDGIAFKPGELERHGTVATSLITDPLGRADYILTPRREAVPGFGTEIEKDGTVVARVDLASVFGNLPAGIQRASRARGFGAHATIDFQNPVFDWHLTYHKPRGFKFSGAKFSFQSTGGSCAADGGPCILNTTVRGRVCGDDPWGQPWDIHHDSTSNYGNAPVEDYPLSLDQPFSIPEVGHRKALEWVGGSHQAGYKVKFTYEAHEDFAPTSPTSVTVSLEEDTSCPENE